MLTRISTTRRALLLIVLVTAACTPRPATPVSPIVISTSELASLPDLTIKLMYLEMEGRQGNCVVAFTTYGIRVVAENIGMADSGPFVVDLNGARQQVDQGLAAGQYIVLHFAGTVPSGRYEADVDAADQVIEHKEDNNSRSFLAPTPSPPPLCTATPIPTP